MHLEPLKKRTKMYMDNPTVLVIAGFDPSGGAGIIADAKTMETIGVQSVFVQSCNTVQSTKTFQKCYWTEETVFWEQLEVLLHSFTPKTIKIGVIKSNAFLGTLLGVLKTKVPMAKIIWDPVVRSSSGFEFHDQNHFFETTVPMLKMIDLITPNFLEVKHFSATHDLNEALTYLSKHCSVYLKGGHRKELGMDELYQPNKLKKVYYPTHDHCSEKHGSGCVLSSAIASYYAIGEDWEESCRLAKLYTERFLASNNTLLGKHSK